MQIDIHHPRFVKAVTHPAGDDHRPFCTITITEQADTATSSAACLYFSADWAEWDALVAAVAEYRAATTQATK